MIVIFLMFAVKSNSNRKLDCATSDPTPICGTISFSEKEKKGKEIFNSNCLACHRLHKKMTGPALAYIDSIKLKTWLTTKNEIDSTKVKNYKIEYHLVTFSNHLNNEDIKSLYEYLKK